MKKNVPLLICVRGLKIASPLCLLPTGAGLLKSLSPKCCTGPNKKKGERRRKEGGIKSENGERSGGQGSGKKCKEGRAFGKMWNR